MVPETNRHLTDRDIQVDHHLTDRHTLADLHLTDRDILANHHLAKRNTQIPRTELVDTEDVLPGVMTTTIAVIMTVTQTVAIRGTAIEINQGRDTDINQDLLTIIGTTRLGDSNQNLPTDFKLRTITQTVIGHIHLINPSVAAGRAIVLDTSLQTVTTTNHKKLLVHVEIHVQDHLRSNIVFTMEIRYLTNQSVALISKVLLTVL